MFTDFIITFRETLEAALVAGIVLSYLSQTNHRNWFKIVYWGIGFGIIGSIIASIIFEEWLGGFSGVSEEIYEGVIMILAACLISWMILWMAKQNQHIKKNLHRKIDKHLESEQKTGIFFIVFLAVLREGIETVLFLKASAFQNTGNNLIGGALGILTAIILGFIFFSGLRHISLKKFFSISTLILVFFAAGLLAHGVHEFQEAGWIPVIIEQVWDINPEIVTEGITPLFHENGGIGSFFKGVLGWNGNPSLLELLSYGSYLILIFISMNHIKKNPVIDHKQ